MIFFFDAKGNLTRALPETIKQGSNRSSRLWFFMPTSSANLVNAHFVLPNGEHAEPLPMTSIGYVPIQPNVDYDKTSYSVWFLDIPKRITQYAGVINISFDIASPNTEFDDDNESAVVESVQVEVVRGIVKPLSPTTENAYAELKTYLAGLQTYVGNLIQGLPDFSIYQEKADESLNTDAKTIEGAINELLLELETLDKLTYKVVDTLPTEGETNTIYLVPNTNSQDKNIKDEYLWIDNKWELIGSTAIDLTDYQQKTDNSLNTKSKEIVGAINEVNSKVGQGGGTSGIQDVQDAKGTSFVENGVATIPIAQHGVLGLVTIPKNAQFGIQNVDNTYNPEASGLGLVPANENEILTRTGARKPICIENMELAEKTIITGAKKDARTGTITLGNQTALTAEEKESAQKWLGVEGLHAYACKYDHCEDSTLVIITKGEAEVAYVRPSLDSLDGIYVSCDKPIVAFKFSISIDNDTGYECGATYIQQRWYEETFDENGDLVDAKIIKGITNFYCFKNDDGYDWGRYEGGTELKEYKISDSLHALDSFSSEPDLLSIPFEKLY